MLNCRQVCIKLSNTQISLQSSLTKISGCSEIPTLNGYSNMIYFQVTSQSSLISYSEEPWFAPVIFSWKQDQILPRTQTSDGISDIPKYLFHIFRNPFHLVLKCGGALMYSWFTTSKSQLHGVSLDSYPEKLQSKTSADGDSKCPASEEAKILANANQHSRKHVDLKLFTEVNSSMGCNPECDFLSHSSVQFINNPVYASLPSLRTLTIHIDFCWFLTSCNGMWKDLGRWVKRYCFGVRDNTVHS